MSTNLQFDIILNSLGKQEKNLIFNCGDTIDGIFKILVRNNSNFSHKGVLFEYVTEYYPEKGKPIILNTSNQIQIIESGNFQNKVELPIPQFTLPNSLQTYHGSLFSIKHILKFIIKKNFGNIEFFKEIFSYSFKPCVTKLSPLCVRVAVSENLRIDLVINRRKFELNDVILGGAHFLLVAIKLMKFEVSLVAQEVSEVLGKPQKNTRNIFTWEISDGAPIKGEIIPFRLFLAPLKLTPSISESSKGYSVSHFLNFLIYSTGGQKYFKSLQIKLGKWVSLPFQFNNE